MRRAITCGVNFSRKAEPFYKKETTKNLCQLFYALCHHGHQDQRVKYDEEEKQNRGQDVVSMATSGKEIILCQVGPLSLPGLLKQNL